MDNQRKIGNNSFLSFIDTILMPERLILINFTLLLVYSIFGTGPSWQAKSDDYYEAESSNLINQVLYSFLFLSTLFASKSNFEILFKFIKKEKYLAIFVALCILSAVWSDYSFISFKRSFQLLVTCFVILTSILFTDYRDLLKIIKIVISLYAIITFITVLIVPDAIDPAFGTWRGIERQKNGLAQLSLICFLLSLLFQKENNNLPAKFYNYTLSLLYAIIIIMAQSSTIIIVFALVASVTIILKIENVFQPLKIKRFFVVLVMLFILVFVSILGIFSTEVFALLADIFEKDLTFTGRTVFWGFLWDQILDNALFGFGYGTYWVMGSPQVKQLFYFEDVMLNTAHSGFIDLLLQLGFFGFFIFVMLVFAFFYRALKLRDNIAFLVLLSILVANFTETTLFTTRGIINFTFIFFYLLVSKKVSNLSVQ